MLHDFADDVPAALRGVETRPLFVMRLDVKPMQIVGATPGGYRRIGLVPSGSFVGDRLSGEVLGGNDWQSVRGDGSTALDVRLTLKSGGDLIAMSYRGIRAGVREVLARVEGGEAVDPADYYFRISPTFETASPTHMWLNDILAVGVGYRSQVWVMYSLFEIL